MSERAIPSSVCLDICNLLNTLFFGSNFNLSAYVRLFVLRIRLFRAATFLYIKKEIVAYDFKTVVLHLKFYLYYTLPPTI